jgi:DNA replication protein DnaC
MSEEPEHAPDMTRVISVSDLMPEVMAIFGRVAQKWTLFQKEQRKPFAQLKPHIFCPQHPKQKLPKQFEETCQKSFQTRQFSPVYAVCPLCQDEESKARRRRFWLKRGVPERLVDGDIRAVQAASPEEASVKAQLVQWKMKGFLILMGPVGVGKSHWASIFLQAKGDGLFITHLDMLSDLRSSYSTHTTAELIHKWREAEMLVLDEFGLSAGGKDEEPMLYQVLADRHDKRRPTIITSNKSKTQIRELLGPRLLDRIREDVTEVQMNWQSYRTKGTK